MDWNIGEKEWEGRKAEIIRAKDPSLSFCMVKIFMVGRHLTLC